jgi:hypothetical protein
VNHARQKAQSLGCIVAIPPDIVLRDPGVKSKEAVHVSGFGKDVGRVSQLWSFDDDGFLSLENVFIPKQINPVRPA